MAAGVWQALAEMPRANVALRGPDSQVVKVSALMDSGCVITVVTRGLLIHHKWPVQPRRAFPSLVTLNKNVQLAVVGVSLLNVEGVSLSCGVVEELPGDLNVVVGLDLVSRVGQLVVAYPQGPEGPCVSYLGPCTALAGAAGVFSKRVDRRTTVVVNPDNSVRIQLPDCHIVRSTQPDGSFRWTAGWQWKDGKPPDRDLSAPGAYPRKLTPVEEEALAREIRSFIDQGFLVKTPKEKLQRILPLLAVLQSHAVSQRVNTGAACF